LSNLLGYACGEGAKTDMRYHYQRVEQTRFFGRLKLRKVLKKYRETITWRNFCQGIRQIDWMSCREPRFILAASTALLFLAGSVTVIQQGIHRTGSWAEVFTNGTYVGMVPAQTETVSQVQRLAAAYDVSLEVVPVHELVPSGYDWSSVMQLPEQAYAVALNGKPLVYTSSSGAANAVLGTVKNSLTPKNLPPNATVKFAGNVTVQQAIIGVADVLTVDSAVKYLLHPATFAPVGRWTSPLDNPMGFSQANAVSGDEQPETNAGTNEAASSNSSAGPLLTVTSTAVVKQKVQVAFPVKKIKNAHMGVGVVKVKTAGKPGVNKETVKLTYKDGRLASRDVLAKDVLSQPKEQVEVVGTNAGVASGSWIWPSPDYDITSGYGPRYLGGSYDFHPGIDIGCPVGTPVYATNNGVVQDAGWNSGGYGIWVVISNGGGIQSIFGHLSRVAVHPGQTVAKGDVIGYSGDTGFATGPHLHYEIRKNGQHINPLPYT